MTYPSLNLNIQLFLDEYWQRQPLVIRGALDNFEDPIDEHDLAGLAQEADIDSRIVSLHNQKWHVEQGPFADFDSVCQGKWTLMVQGVDKWIEEISALAKAFAFIPYWRFDDVMVSYAVPGAGVGPHVDQYDVFLLQGKGKRRWQVGKPGRTATLMPHAQLKQVAAFDPVIDVELEPGDILYIPPGWPHCGESLAPSLTYSMGFRAPDARDLLQPINDALFAQDEMPRYRDSALSATRNAFEVDNQELTRLTEMVSASLDSEHWQKTLLCYLSDQGLPLQSLEPPMCEEQVEILLKQAVPIHPVPGCKPLINSRFSDILFINGEPHTVMKSIQSTVLALFETQNTLDIPRDNEQKLALIQLVTILLNNGILFFED